MLVHWQIGLCLARVYRVMNARGKFGEHERSVRVTPGTTESNYSFLRPNLYTKIINFLLRGERQTNFLHVWDSAVGLVYLNRCPFEFTAGKLRNLNILKFYNVNDATE